ncbi:grasp-with-spasm system ATP-grasp peptide maturase [Pedobacter zeae]|uniref:ATP-GRASP peptide maturase of grasp-with-spasm system n=1 Tax=Pedobacter zeae TaxID=1737356 RepID=A0A7W6P5C6_9SPHI|nr:grasp-with-spasm system ATP-grasp peptide maturase [Pedobacter zeae]MBB4106749.1 ATP-GRASP peptide maturase of grasp-with-spasm system [Pedobacter zeae]GGH03528.1 hypothetical protein GCM10007422_18620 [Pedobacter zeae]
MVYILSEKTDRSTDLVTEWLVYLKSSFKRLNDEERVEASISVSNNGVESRYYQPRKVWHRRGNLNFLPDEIYDHYPDRTAFLRYFTRESSVLGEFFESRYRKLLGRNYIGSISQESLNNKLLNLVLASKNGFLIPQTLVTSNKEELVAFYKEHGCVITKDLRAPVNILSAGGHIVSDGVKLLNDKMIEQLEEKFVPVFLQKYVQKKYEIRSFAACDKIYSMAIFSQGDESTMIDYRNYNNKKPNRCVPVNLPPMVEQNLRNLMAAMEMNTGSFDLIVNKENEYYFLEVNPMGQFHWLSESCNYHIERDIAQFLADGK